MSNADRSGLAPDPDPTAPPTTPSYWVSADWAPAGGWAASDHTADADLPSSWLTDPTAAPHDTTTSAPVMPPTGMAPWPQPVPHQPAEPAHRHDVGPTQPRGRTTSVPGSGDWRDSAGPTGYRGAGYGREPSAWRTRVRAYGREADASGDLARRRGREPGGRRDLGPRPGAAQAVTGRSGTAAGQPQYPASRRMNTRAILSLVFAFVFFPVGLALGLSAHRQIRRTGEAGEGVARAGIFLSAFFGVIFLIVIVLPVVLLLLGVL